MTIFGRRDSWAIEIDPLAGGPVEPDPAGAATWASIRLWAANRNLTAHTRTDTLEVVESLHWPAAFLARWILNTWPAFWERAGSPMPDAPVSAARACAQLDAYISDNIEHVDEGFLDQRDEFVASHTLLAAAAGGVMPPLYLLKDAGTVFIEWVEAAADSQIRFHASPGRTRVSSGQFLETTRAFMSWCADATRGSTLGNDIDDWDKRLDSPAAAESVLAGYLWPWGAKRSRKSSTSYARVLNLPMDWKDSHALLDPSRFSAAVVFRALSPIVSEDDIATFLTRLRTEPANAAAAKRLEELGADLQPESEAPPYSQGYALAALVRDRLNNPDRRFDVEDELQKRGIRVHDEALTDDSIDAATVWDDGHGPVIIANKTRKHEAPWARRMTLAHELCHLLVDKRKSVPLMIASTPWAPPDIEQRANAFAAELLLPRAGILRVVGQNKWPFFWEERILRELMDEFGVGETVCTHQLRNRMRIFP